VLVVALALPLVGLEVLAIRGLGGLASSLVVLLEAGELGGKVNVVGVDTLGNLNLDGQAVGEVTELVALAPAVVLVVLASVAKLAGAAE
jgi:hypothetical protein